MRCESGLEDLLTFDRYLVDCSLAGGEHLRDIESWMSLGADRSPNHEMGLARRQPVEVGPR